jgi:hypothetical protein
MLIFEVFVLFMLDNHIFDIANCDQWGAGKQPELRQISAANPRASIMDWEPSNIQVASLSMQRMTRESLEIIQQSQKAHISIEASLEGCGYALQPVLVEVPRLNSSPCSFGASFHGSI